jgi:hypothetical protein
LLVGFANAVLTFEAAPCSPEVPDAPLAPLAPLALVELELLPHAASPRAAATTATTKAMRTNVVLSAALTTRAQYPGARRKSIGPPAPRITRLRRP